MTIKATSKAVAKIDDGPKELTQAQAQKITDRIRAGLNKTAETLELIKQARDGKAWKVLHDCNGDTYKSWEAYVTGEFPETALKLPSARRKEVVMTFHNLGWSTRAIAPVVGGVDNKTVHNDIKEVEAAAPTVENSTVAGDDLPIIDGEIVDPDPVDEPLASIHGLDGRDRPATQRRQPKSKDAEVVAAATKLAKKLETLIGQIDDFYDDSAAARVNVEVETILGNLVSRFFDMARNRDLLPEEYKAVAATV